MSLQRPGDSLHGTVEVLGDILEPVLPAEAWEAQGGATLLTQDDRIVRSALVPVLT